MSIKEKLVAKIDLKDAIFGGISIYVSVLLISYLIIFGSDYALRMFNIINSNGEFVVGTGILAENFYGFLVAGMLGLFFITFFLIVLFEESLFFKHEKGIIDLIGLGIIWGTVFVTVDTLLQSVIEYLSMFMGWETYYMFSVRSSLVGIFYWFSVLYIILLPAAVYFLRKNHREHYAKVTSNK